MIKKAIVLAHHFGQCLAQQDYITAHSLLTTEIQQEYSPEKLGQAVQGMTAYTSGKILEVKVIEECLLTEWQLPPMEPKDIVWLYVSLSGEDFGEAVSVVVCEQDGELAIRFLEWGRP